VKGFQVDGRRGGIGTSFGPEYPGSPFEQLRLPLGDLIWMDIELLGQFSQRLLALGRGQSHFRFKSRCVVPAWSFAHRLSCSTAILAAFRQKLHLSRRPNSSGHLYIRNILARELSEAGPESSIEVFANKNPLAHFRQRQLAPKAEGHCFSEWRG
jgi:hypothetical protein